MVNIVEERIKKWKDKLIDLSLRNRLLNFRPTKITTIKIVNELPSEILHILAVLKEGIEFLPVSDGPDLVKEGSGETDSSVEFKPYEKDEIEQIHKDTYLQTSLTKEQLSRNLFRIYSEANSVMEEQGHNVLFLSLGCLEWYESEDSNVKLKAPIILVPIDLTRTSVKSKFKLKYHEEDTFIINPALIVKMQTDFGITINQINEEDENIDPQQIFSQIQEAVKSQNKWRITNDIYLSLFSFAKFIMYKDLEKFMDILLNNPIIKIIGGSLKEAQTSLGLLVEEKELDRALIPTKTFQILDADSSQQQAILAAKNGKNLVIEGPPGTGKSQTIANIISEFLAEGKKVLFVSQKMAALEVVKKRLDENNLGDFCLELHSRKANKDEVIKELVRVLEMQNRPDHCEEEALAKLKEIREVLNNYVRDIHVPYGKLEMTPYQAFGIINIHADMQDMHIVFTDSKEWDRKKYENCCDLMDNLSRNLSKIGNLIQHPWYGSRVTDIHYQDKLKIIELVDSINNNYLNLQKQNYIQQLAKYSYFIKPNSISEVDSLIDASNLLARAPEVEKSILENERWDSLSEDAKEIINTVKFFNEFNVEMELKYSTGKIIAENINLNQLMNSYGLYIKNPFLILTASFWKNRSLLKKYIIDKKYKPTLRNITLDLGKIIKGKEAAEKINNIDILGKELFGIFWKGKETKWEELDNFSKWITKFRYYVVKKYFNDVIFEELRGRKINIEDSMVLCNALTDVLNKLKNNIRILIELINLDEALVFGTTFLDIPLTDLLKKFSNMKENIDYIDEWARYQNILQVCKDTGLGDFVNKIMSVNLPSERIVDTFKCQFLRNWLDFVFSERTSLKRFYGEEHEKIIQKFRELDRKHLELTKVKIQHLLSGKFNTADISSVIPSKNSELGILLRESRKARAHIPIRKLFEVASRIVLDLKPCLMMSPVTVAQFLNPELIKFDLIIFDEASQIPPEDSVGAILRGNQVVIAGDSKQLPPTSFFQSSVITSEDIEDTVIEEMPEDLPSILDECAARTGISHTMLLWHYRSRHESLIAFSNKEFYGNKLFTFPCAEEKNPYLGIRLHYNPKTTYDRGGSGTNIEEGREVADAVFQHFKKSPELSLGIGTFSIRQQRLIVDIIDKKLREDNSLEAFFAKDKPEHFFVKNLETIQGDERDIIFISVGYGKDLNGKLPMNFGPINQVGGPRRLNVLVTRARKRVEIFSSIKGEDFDLSKTDSEGVRLLKEYLEFADKGKSALSQEIARGGFSESFFEESVYNLLLQNGIKVDRQVGCSGYRIDLAVVDENNPGRYILGIECDGAFYHSSSTARDRDRLRQQILEELNWNIYRIWSTDWFRNPRLEAEKLFKTIEKVKSGEFIREKISINSDCKIDYKYESVKDSLGNKENNLIKTYSKIPISSLYPSESFYLMGISKIASILESVVNYEGPIHKEEAARRVIQYWDLRSVGSRIRGILESAEVYSISNKMIKKRGEFYWPINMVKPNVRGRRDIEDLNKKIELIAPEEIGEAALIVLQKEYSMPKEELINQTARLLGFDRLTEQISTYISEGIEFYKKDNKIVDMNGRLTRSENERR